MASNPASPQTDKDRIERWREETSLTQERDFGTIARLCNTCLELLRILLQHSGSTRIRTPENRKLRQCYSMLQLWDHGHGVVEGRLDNHLAHSTEVRRTAIEVLLHFCGCLLDGVSTFALPHAKEESVKLQYASALDFYGQNRWLLKIADESSSEDNDDSDEDNAKDDSFSSRADAMARRIKTYTDCLMGFGSALDCPAPDDAHDEEPGVAGGVPPSAHDYHTERIRRKYDKAEIRLLKILGQVSWSRFLRMQYERNNHTAAVDEPQQRTFQHTATSVGPVSEFEDSGIGTSLMKTQSSYAESIASFMTSISGGERVRIPPLPAEGRNGLPFECTACGKLVRATNNREWRKHLYTDLQPYSCFYHECRFSMNPFSSRQVWINHLELEHNFGPAWEAIECPLCLNTSGNGKSTILNHLSQHMEDIALVALPPGLDSDAGSDASVQLTDDTTESGPTNPGQWPEALGTNLAHGIDMSHVESYPVSVITSINRGGSTLQASCNACVASNIRCSKERPICAHCSANKLQCAYNDRSYQSSGLLQLKTSTKGMCFVVLKHNDSDTKILEQYVRKDVGFSRNSDDRITWTRENGEKVELILQTTKDCDSLWNRLEEANDRPVQGNDRENLLEPSSLAILRSSRPTLHDWVQQPDLSARLVHIGEQYVNRSQDTDRASGALESETVHSISSTVPPLIHQANDSARTPRSDSTKGSSGHKQYIYLLKNTEDGVKEQPVHIKIAPITHSVIRHNLLSEDEIDANTVSREGGEVHIPGNVDTGTTTAVPYHCLVELTWRRPESGRTHRTEFCVVSNEALDDDIIISHTDTGIEYPAPNVPPLHPEPSHFQGYNSGLQPSGRSPFLGSFHRSADTNNDSSRTQYQTQHNNYAPIIPETMNFAPSAPGGPMESRHYPQNMAASNAFLGSQPTQPNLYRATVATAASPSAAAETRPDVPSDKLRIAMKWDEKRFGVWLYPDAPWQVFFEAFRIQAEKRKKLWDRTMTSILLKESEEASDEKSYELFLDEDDLDADWNSMVKWIGKNKRTESPHIFGTVMLAGEAG